jgi:hypothetical protein
MPHASRRLDLLVLPKDVDQPLDESAVSGLFEGWGVDIRGHSPQASSLVEGGCKRIWLDQPGRLWLYGNQAGGFRVRCPTKGDNISAAFGRAHRAWKDGSPRTFDCTVCGAVHPLEACHFEPPAAFARWAVVFSDVGAPVLSAGTEAQLMAVLGPIQLIGRRP